MTLEQLQDYINTYIKPNGRKAISGSQMNYLMLAFVDWVQTTTTNDVEDAIVNGVTDKAPSQNAVFDALAGKQATLVSGTNIKTINSASILGPGDLSLQATLVSGTNIKTINGTSLLGSGDISIVSTPGGSNSQVQFNSSGSFAGDSAFIWDNVNKRLGIGAAPASTVLLDLRSQGSGSGDIVFRVRNSANTQNQIEILGNGRFRLGDDQGGLVNAFTYVADGRLFMVKSGSNFIEMNSSGNNRLYNISGGWLVDGNTTISTYAVSGSGGSGTWQFFAGTLQIGGLVATGGASNSIWIHNGTSPATNYADRHWYYSADIVAGNAAPHFRTENGDILKIYSIGGWGTPTGILNRTTFDESTVTLQQLAQRVAALITDLKTGHQLLKA